VAEEATRAAGEAAAAAVEADIMSSTTTEGAIKAAEGVAGAVMMMDTSKEEADGDMMGAEEAVETTGDSPGPLIGAGTEAGVEGSMMAGIMMIEGAGVEAIMTMVAAEGAAGADTTLAGVSGGIGGADVAAVHVVGAAGRVKCLLCYVPCTLLGYRLSSVWTE
jgi:hypothetical protein